MNDGPLIDYLAIGHVSHDLTSDGPVSGGTVTYSSRAAQALGCRTAVLTSAAEDFDLHASFAGIDAHRIPAPVTTTFENHYTATGREQKVRSIAEPITSDQVPVEWLRAKIVHLGPIAGEIELGLANLFSNSMIGVTPQGWFRRIGADGTVYANDWPDGQEVLKLAAAVILSPEDISNSSTVDQIREWCPLVVVTQRDAGCIVYFRDDTRHIPAPTVAEVNPTGAGDIFAASFFVRLHQTKGNPWEAANFANQVAAGSVTKNNLDEKIEIIKKFKLAT